jgi:hypothetical protein
VDLQRLVTAIAFLSSLAAALVTVGGGLALLLIEDSGERGTGVLLALGGTVAFVLALILLFARDGAFSTRFGNLGALGAAILSALPAAGLAFAAFRFARLPVGSPIPLIDWPVFAAGLALGLGVVALLARGYRRSQGAGLPPIVHMQQIREARQQLQSALDHDLGPTSAIRDDDEVRVRRV